MVIRSKRGILLVVDTRPFRTTGLMLSPRISDWPEAGVALAFASSGILSLDQNLEAKPVPGGEPITHDWHRLLDENAITGQLKKALLGRNYPRANMIGWAQSDTSDWAQARSGREEKTLTAVLQARG